MSSGTALALLANLRSSGVHIGLDAGDLLLSGDRTAIQAHLDEIRAHKPALVALLHQQQTASVSPDLDRFSNTDRRTCADCQGLSHDGRCLPAAHGHIPQTARVFYPIRNRPMRCIAFDPRPDDPDQRPGRERWPHQYARWRAQQSEASV